MEEGDRKDAQNVYDSNVVEMHEQFVDQVAQLPVSSVYEIEMYYPKMVGTESSRKWCNNNSELVNNREG